MIKTQIEECIQKILDNELGGISADNCPRGGIEKYRYMTAFRYQNFIVEIRNDENDEILSNNEKKRLIELLQYEQFQLNLMKEEGAIDRIYQKVAENETGDSRDVMALFETRDFEVDVNERCC